MSRKGFDDLLLEAVDNALSSLGKSSKQAIYFHLAKSFDIKKEEIPNRLDDFAIAIERIFGLGANFLEMLIIKRIYENSNVVFVWDESKKFSFVEYIKEARRRFHELNRQKSSEILIEYGEPAMGIHCNCIN